MSEQHVELAWKDTALEYEAVCFRNFDTNHYHLTVEIYSSDLQCQYSWAILDNSTFKKMSEEDAQHLNKSVAEMLEKISQSYDVLDETKTQNRLLKEKIVDLEKRLKNALNE